MIDRRKFPRFAPKWQVNYQVLLDQIPIQQGTVNIGGRGICFMADEAITPGTSVSIELESEQLPSAIYTLAKVVWCKPVAQAYEVGAEFQWIGWKKDIMYQGNFPQTPDILELFP